MPDWINPEKGLASCPECDGFGTVGDDDQECVTCDGDGVADEAEGQAYLAGLEEDAAE